MEESYQLNNTVSFWSCNQRQRVHENLLGTRLLFVWVRYSCWVANIVHLFEICNYNSLANIESMLENFRPTHTIWQKAWRVWKERIDYKIYQSGKAFRCLFGTFETLKLRLKNWLIWRNWLCFQLIKFLHKVVVTMLTVCEEAACLVVVAL